jgi:tetratricopeptide (TPR) repeat protein
MVGATETDPKARLLAQALRLHRLGRLDDAERGYRQVLATDPDDAQALHLLGMIAAQRGKPADALDLIGRSLALAPDVGEAHYNLGVALQDLARTEEAAAAYRRALALRPDVAETHMQLSNALQELGDTAEALAAVDRALAIDPAFVRAWYVRRDLKTFVPGDPDIERMEALLASADARRLDDDDRLLLDFALGKAWMDVGDAGRAFAHLEAGNRRKRAGFAYDVATEVEWLAAIAESVTPETIAAFAGAGDPSDLPVFVLGMPRSGTTLVEQILASHAGVHGAGELLVLEELTGRDWERDDLADSYQRLMRGLTASDLSRLGGAYVERVAALAGGKRRVVDKSPGNFRLAGLIHLMAPNARIIHCRRDPVDTCFSLYSRNFSGRVRYAFDLRELGLYYRAYERLMAHWRAVLPADRFIEVDYEALVGDLEEEARRLIGFCGLEWDEACLEFHATRRLVRTISVNQVRRPIYRSSIERWKPYEPHLGPLLQALGRR